ncbi:ras guanine nucleotide exchange factor domain-containing protein, partial [Phycomyces blakesleeanus]
LPPNWVSKTTPSGRLYFCNVVTEQTTWNLENIDFQTGALVIFLTSTHICVNQSLVDAQVVSWSKVSAQIAMAIQTLKNSIRNETFDTLQKNTISVVYHVRLLLYLSNSIDKDSSPQIKSNKKLRTHHRGVMASLAKLALSSKVASGAWPPPESINKLHTDADEVLVAVRNFIITAQEAQLDLHDNKPKLLHDGVSPLRWRVAGVNRVNGANPDATTTLLVLADNIHGATTAFIESANEAFSDLNPNHPISDRIKTTSPVLVAQFRNLSNTTSQFLNSMEDICAINPKQSSYFAEEKQAIFDDMGTLFIISQAITNQELGFDEIKSTFHNLEQCVKSIEKSVRDICDISRQINQDDNIDLNKGSYIKDSATPLVASAVNGSSTALVNPSAVVDSDGCPTAGASLYNNERTDFLGTDYNSSEIIFNMEGNVKGGTIRALVQRLTQHDKLDSKFITTFLLTYRSFCTTQELFEELFMRYMLTPPEDLTAEELTVWQEKKLKLVRLRVFNVIKSWLDTYFNEEEDQATLPTLAMFTEDYVRVTMKFGYDQLIKLIKKRMDSEENGQIRKMTLNIRSEMPQPILPKNMRRIRFLELDALEMARQLTIMDFKLYNRIKPVECLDKNWGKGDSEHIAVNVKASIEYSNQVTAWVTDSILSKDDVRKRAVVVKHWVVIAEKCRLLNNYNTCMAILSSFDNSSVGRLRRTWELMNARTNQTLASIRRLMGANRNFTEYRDIIHHANPPCIPFLGIYLQDLTFIEDGNSNYLKKSDNMINFSKRMKTAEVIRELQQHQSTPYLLQAVPDIQEFITTHLQSSRDEETLYNLSLALEPRERDEDTIVRRLKESGM